ncbi:MAG: CmcJ/NvfI family oxidoreductase [Stellaceae bacterium]
MPGLAALTGALPAVDAVINYIDPDAPIGGINDAEREKSTFTLVPFEVTIHDMRPITGSLSLDRNGFVLLERAAPACDFYDPAAVARDYYPEIERLIRELTGAERVVIFGHLARHDGPNPPPGAHRSVTNAHIDYDLPTTRAVADRYLADAEKARFAGGRVMQINVWRPIATVESMPLALCDAASVAKADLVYGPIGGKSQSQVENAAGYNLAHNPAHRWYYVPRMRPEEVFVFRLCDSDPAAPQWTAHTGFRDPTSPPDAKPRQSIEVRTLALFPS